MKSIPIKRILLSDLEDSEHIEQNVLDDESNFVIRYTSFAKKLGESGTDDDSD